MNKILPMQCLAGAALSIGLGLWQGVGFAQEAGRRYAENSLQQQPALQISVGIRDADIIGNDHRALQAAVDYVGNLGGGTVVIGPGEYTMNDSLHLRSRVTVRGAGERTVLRKSAEFRSRLAADGDFGEAAITVEDPSGLKVGQGVYVASDKFQAFLGVCATIINADANYFTLSRPMNADIMVADGGFAATIYPVVSGYVIEDARIENLTVDGNRDENPTRVDGCRVAGIYLYRGDHSMITNCTVRDFNGDGISFQQSNDVRVEECTVERCGGFGLHPGSGSQRPSVVRCRSVNNDSDGLFFCWRVRGGIAEENWLEGNGGFGMSIGHKDSDNSIRGNTIIGNAGGGVYWRDEAAAMAAHRVTFEQNTVQDNSGFGVFIDGATSGTILRNNAIRDTGKGRQTTGIRLGAQVGSVAMNDNEIEAMTPLLDERKAESDAKPREP
jgi:parallel beta-helix repeat protein